jgi:MinD superfamily P-loop ATPase
VQICGFLKGIRIYAEACAENYSWHHRCQQCFACINNCPCNAIEYLKLSVGKKRYRNPYIKLEELMKK